MKNILLAGAAALLLSSCNDDKSKDSASAEAVSEPAVGETQIDEESIQTGEVTADPIAMALLDSGRSQEARDRDAGRKPGQVLRFAQIEPGQTVVDIASSNDYYAPILSKVLGPEGKLIMVEPKRLEEFFPQAIDAAAAYAAADDTDNITSIRVNLDEIAFDEPVDRVLNILYYHDTVWSGVDRAAMNKAIYDALKPGGYYLIIDHAAKAGAGDEVTNDLHRIDPAVVIPEIEAAGFVLAKQSDILANPDDPKDGGVFGEMRGKTDRFVYLFQKQ